MADAPELIHRSRVQNANFDVYAAPQIVDVFADGVGQVLTGPAVTKLELYRLVGFEGEGDDRVEKRELFMRITMPSLPLVEATGNILFTLGSSVPQFEAATKAITDVVIAAVKKVHNVQL
jgi:hypothetical protein